MRRSMIERARGGDADAFDELVTLDADRCLGIAFRITRDLRLAEDAVQEALVLVWRDLPKLRDVERYEMWLHRLVVNACYTELRRRRRWTDRIAQRPAVKRGRMVNRTWGDPRSQLHERHQASDFDTKTQDKLSAQ